MRKKKKQDNRLYCPYCGRQAVLRPAMYVYGERNLDPEKKGWQQLYENLEKIQIGYERIPGFFRNGL